MKISEETRDYLNSLRGVSILRVVLGHLGLFWLFPPYSEFFHALLPLLFFVSGAVSYGSYLRTTSNGSYLYRRLVGIAAPYYAIIFAGLLIGFLGNISASQPTFDSILRILSITPKSGDVFFPIGQVWFIHALVLIVVFGLPFFMLSRNNLLWLFPPIIVSLIVAIIEFFSSIYGSFFVAGHNLYQPVVNAGFFFLGALYITQVNHPKLKPIVIGAAVLTGLGATAVPLVFQTDVGLSSHAYAPDIYYLLCSLFAIALVVIMRKIIISVIYNLSYVKSALDFVSTHAYSIFMTHSFFIYASEEWLGLMSVKGSLVAIVAKVSIVLAASFATAPVATAMTKKLSSFLLANLSLAKPTGARPANNERSS